MPAYNLDQSYTTGQDNSEGGLIGLLRIAADNTQIIGQSFTPTLTGQLDRVELYLKKLGSPTGNIWCEIHVDGADPSAATQVGSDSSLVDISTVGSGSYAYVAFDFTPMTLTPDVEYWILLYGDNSYGSTNSVFWGADTSSPSYSGGIAGRYGNGGAAWEDISSYDQLFKTYHDDAPYAGGFYHMSV